LAGFVAQKKKKMEDDDSLARALDIMASVLLSNSNIDDTLVVKEPPPKDPFRKEFSIQNLLEVAPAVQEKKKSQKFVSFSISTFNFFVSKCRVLAES
jgi:hypothetical protein